MKRPVVLRSGSLDPVCHLNPVQLSVTMKLTPNHVANMSLLPEEAGKVQIGTWVNIYAGQENCGVFIVQNKSINTDGMCQLTLNGASCLLTDSLIFTEWNGKQDKKSPASAIKAALGYQSSKHFVYNSCSFGSSYAQPWKFEKMTVLAALNQIVGCLPDSQLVFDTTVYPFTVTVKKVGSNPTCGLELSRGMTDVSIKEDRAQMYTRLYPTGQGNTRIDGDYVEKNTKKYGIIQQTATESSLSDKAALKAWAQNELQKHCKPILTIEATAYRLKELTGASWDRPVLGSICRVRFDGDVYDERVEQINWSDALNAPEVVRVTLGAPPVTLTSIVKQKTGGGGGKKLDDKVMDAAGDWYYVAFGKEWRNDKYSFFVDAVKNNQFLANLTLTYDTFKTTIQDKVNKNSSSITQLADSIELKVNKSSVKLEDGVLTIEGARLDVPDIVAKTITADYISSRLSQIENLTAKNIACSSIVSTNGVTGAAINCLNGTGKFKQLVVKDSAGTQRTVSWKSQKVITSVKFSDYSYNETTINYLGR